MIAFAVNPEIRASEPLIVNTAVEADIEIEMLGEMTGEKVVGFALGDTAHGLAESFEGEEIVQIADRKISGFSRAEGGHPPLEEAQDLAGAHRDAFQIGAFELFFQVPQRVEGGKGEQAAGYRHTFSARPR